MRAARPPAVLAEAVNLGELEPGAGSGGFQGQRPLEGAFRVRKTTELALDQPQMIDGVGVARIVVAGLLECGERRIQIIGP